MKSDVSTTRKSRSNQGGRSGREPWWKAGFVVFSEVTGWIVVPIVAALFGGRYFDQRQGTANVFFLSLTAVAFIISSIGILRVGMKYMQKIQNEANAEKQKNNEHSASR